MSEKLSEFFLWFVLCAGMLFLLTLFIELNPTAKEIFNCIIPPHTTCK